MTDVGIVTHNNYTSPELDAGWLSPTLPVTYGALAGNWGQDVGFRNRKKLGAWLNGKVPVKPWIAPQKIKVEIGQMLQQLEDGGQAVCQMWFSVSGHTWDCGGLDNHMTHELTICTFGSWPSISDV